MPATRVSRTSCLSSGFGMVLAFLLAAPAAWATDYHWIGAGTGGNMATDPADPTTQWAGAANWQEGSAPDASGIVYLPLANAVRAAAGPTPSQRSLIDRTAKSVQRPPAVCSFRVRMKE